MSKIQQINQIIKNFPLYFKILKILILIIMFIIILLFAII